MKKISLYSLTIAAAAMAAATSCHHKQAGHDQEVPEISVAEATVDSITLYNTYPATLSANNQVNLVARVNGYLKSVDYKSGQLVDKGTVLFTIESQPYIDQVNNATAALATARSSYEYASSEYAAMQKALQSDAVSQMEVLQAKNEMDQAKSQIEQAEASLQTARTNLSYCTVRSPLRGHVSDNLYSVGSYMSGAGAPVTLSTVYDDEIMIVQFSVDESQKPDASNDGRPLGPIDYSQIPVTFTEAVSRPYTASLYYLDPAVNTSTGTIQVKAHIKNPDGELRDGMYATVHLPYATNPKAVMVLDAALSTDQLGKYLYTVNDSNRVVYTPVEVGDLYNDTLRVINSGIEPGTRYVTKALLKVRDGMTVKPVMSK